MGANDFIRWRELYDRLATRRPGINPALNGFTEEDPVLEGVEGTIAPTVQIGVDLTAWLRNEGNRIAFFAAQTVVGATQYIELFVTPRIVIRFCTTHGLKRQRETHPLRWR